ncbi:helix-turn-helix transcriptional regulator [Actinoplanes sp. LDG1-06]|uniref:Helix-turn-helix transcriptional regulator n=1 Tax=Paractinoplanes ovalisporus TaxID=2810368 RepID=A0ABS2AVB3_9ACTN|nr:effector-associated domain EAD1-containing protein [Actinoplanes ovalisporus]MBM2623089.1 helix-turn-helix transcriptional regulator [Actinoplanes ovalisporus]
MSGVSVTQGVAERIKQMRAARGWSAQNLADECAQLGVPSLTRGTIAKIESGVRKSVTAEELDILARALRTGTDELLRGSAPRPTHVRLAQLMSRLFFTEESARSVLLRAGFPAQLLPAFASPESFWSEAVRLMEMGIGPGDALTDLVEDAAATFRGNREIQAFRAEMAAPVIEAGPALRRGTADQPTHTLTLTGVDMPDEFLEVVRGQFGEEVDLLYVSRQQSSVSIPDPGDRVEQVRREIEELVRTYAPEAELAVYYEKYPFRPYLLSQLTVFGPDTTPYLLQSVPATATPRDIAAAIVAETRQLSDRTAVVVDSEAEGGVQRLRPDSTLHDNDVRDDAKLRVSAEARAGGSAGAPSLQVARRETRLRAVLAQVRAFAADRTGFAITFLDHPEVPTRIVVEFSAAGFVPPDDTPQPLPVHHHRVTIDLPPTFPTTPPTVIWNTPVFHPNIWPPDRPGFRPMTVCVREIFDDYDPGLDFGDLCALLVDLAGYRYQDQATACDPAAERWAASPDGQAMIAGLASPGAVTPRGRETPRRGPSAGRYGS